MLGPIVWTAEQQLVIQAPASARLIVDAGPGTGKTATLCARIAWLLETAKLEPGEIWIISFTRTAVAEIRNRVSNYLHHPAVVSGIKVATIDSHAWAMNVGFNEDAVLSGGFDDNIRQVIKTITQNEHAAEYIGSVKHLFIDEAPYSHGICSISPRTCVSGLPPAGFPAYAISDCVPLRFHLMTRSPAPCTTRGQSPALCCRRS